MAYCSRHAALLISGCLVLTLGCRKDATPAPDTPAPGVKAAGPPVTEAEAKEFGAKLAQAMQNGDVAEADRLLHLQDLLERLVSDLDLPAPEREGLVRGAASTMAGPEGLVRAILRAVADGGAYTFLRVHTVDGRPRALFRLILPNGTFNYHDIMLARFRDGVGAEDLYVFLTAEPFSQSMRRLLIPAVAQQRQGGSFRGKEDDPFQGVSTFAAMVRASQQGQFAQAAENYRRLPPKLQTTKAALAVYLGILAQQGEAAEKESIAAMEKFRLLYPDDPAVDFISINYYGLQKRYDEAITCVSRVDRAVGGDPYLWVMRAIILFNARRFDEARAVAEQAVEAEPTLMRAYEIRIRVALRERNHSQALEWLKKMAQVSGGVPPQFEADPECAEFIRSPQYREWKLGLGKR